MAFTSFQGAEFAFEPVPLAELGAWSKRAALAGRVPVAYLRASWCGANVQLEKSLGDERMARALREVAVAVFDVDDGVDGLIAAGLDGRSVPVFFLLDADGKPTGQRITGAAWGQNTPENMAPPLEQFFEKARAARPSRVSEAPARGAYAAPVAVVPSAPAQPSRAAAMLMVVLGLGALVAGAWWKVSSDERDSRARADEEQRERISKDVDASIREALKKK